MVFDALSTTAGVLLIGVGTWDIVQTVVRPGAQGRVTHRMMRVGWRAMRFAARWQPRLLDFVGPMLFFLVVATWVSLLTMGWALLYLPFMPDGFLFAAGLPEEGSSAIVESVYLSLVTLAALGYGDVTPAEPWLRIVGPLEAMFGLVLFSATIWWLLSIYPVLGRQRLFARRVALVRRALEESGGLGALGASGAEVVGELAGRVQEIAGDLAQLPEMYYFHPGAREGALVPKVLPFLCRLAEEGEREGDEGTRFRAYELRLALEELAHTLDALFLREGYGDVDRVFRAYARDHLVEL